MPDAPAHPSPNRDAAIAVLKALRANGHTAFFAGGCVRDELLGLAPTDYDIATDATPDQVQKLFKKTNAVGASFGVVLVRDDHTTTEVATFRTDGPYSDSRRPDHVTFSSPEEDAKRRDFTINALFLDPLETDEDKRIIDFVNGREDLAQGIIRAVGDPDRRFDEDDLRALRAIRFACKFGFTIEPRTREAITKHAPGLAGVSRERIGDETRKVLAHHTRAGAVELMQQLVIDSAVLDAEHSINPTTTLRALTPEATPVAAMLAWAIDRAGTWPTPVAASAFRRALMLSNDETSALSAATNSLLAMTIPPNAWESLPVAKRKRLASEPGSLEARTVLHAIDPERAATIETDIHALDHDGIGLRPTPLITGDHLIAQRFTPGPGFATLLAAVYDAQLEGTIADTNAAIALAIKLSPDHNISKD